MEVYGKLFTGLENISCTKRSSAGLLLTECECHFEIKHLCLGSQNWPMSSFNLHLWPLLRPRVIWIGIWGYIDILIKISSSFSKLIFISDLTIKQISLTLQDLLETRLICRNTWLPNIRQSTLISLPYLAQLKIRHRPTSGWSNYSACVKAGQSLFFFYFQMA